MTIDPAAIATCLADIRSNSEKMMFDHTRFLKARQLAGLPHSVSETALIAKRKPRGL